MYTEESDPGKNKPTLRERLMRHLVHTVPDEIAMCEFHCSKTDCSNAEWKDCKRRLASLDDQNTDA